MDPALNQTLENINQANSDATWIWFAVLVIAPVALIFIYIPVALIEQRRILKCPNCGNWRRNKATIQKVKTVEGNKSTTITQRAIVCKKCKNEFSR